MGTGKQITGTGTTEQGFFEMYCNESCLWDTVHELFLEMLHGVGA